MRTRARIFGILLLAAVPLLAAEFWENKPFREWNRSELRRMLTRSPWAQQITTSLDPAGLPGVSQVPSGGGFPGANPAGPLDGGTSSRSPAPNGEPFSGNLQRIIVRWHSALPVRQALVRSSISSETAAQAGLSDAALRFLEPQTEYYIVTISGLPATAAEATLGPQQLARAAALKRKGRPDLRPEKVEVEADAPRAGLSFYFCRSHEVTLADREIEFRLDLPDLRVARKFRLKDMVFQGRLEL